MAERLIVGMTAYDSFKCFDEQSFKIALQKTRSELTFCIETEETVAGFPDVMVRHEDGRISFEEYKYTKTGKIKFQPTQPAFYKKYCGKLDIAVVAYNAKSHKVHRFSVHELFDSESPYSMDGNTTVDLRRAE